MPKRTSDYRAGLMEELRDPQMAADYLNAAIQDSEEMFLRALRDVAEARQMAKVAEGAGVSRESLYRMLSEAGNPCYSSLVGIFKALKLRFSVEPIADATETPLLESQATAFLTGVLRLGQSNLLGEQSERYENLVHMSKFESSVEQQFTSSQRLYPPILSHRKAIA